MLFGIWSVISLSQFRFKQFPIMKIISYFDIYLKLQILRQSYGCHRTEKQEYRRCSFPGHRIQKINSVKQRKSYNHGTHSF